jgi:bacterioferritin
MQKHNGTEGPITEEYHADPREVCEKLNLLRSTEIVTYLQYKQHAYMTVSMLGPSVSTEFIEHADEELEHADRLAKRIQALGGVPIFDPEEIAKCAERLRISPEQGSTLEDMVREDFELEREQVRVYTRMVREVGDRDIVTRRLLEDILEQTEDHAAEMWDLLQSQAATREPVLSGAARRPDINS